MIVDHDLTGVMLDGRYRLTRLMGQGGMGQVYEGIHEFLNRRVAVKVLLPRLACEAKHRERFLREAKAASKVLHPNVVKILDFGETPNGSVYFVMELLPGRDLKALLHQTGALPWPRARHLLLQITAALQAAHAHRIIHRDIKPANCVVMATEDDQELVKLLDFGIAKVTADPSDQSNSLANSLTATGEVFGSVKYMAPEQATGFSDDPRVDVYSVGILAYEMLTGQVPFSGPFAFHVVSKHVNEPPRPPRQLNPAIPPAVETIILRALAKHPDHRFESMRQMKRALAKVPPDADGGTMASGIPGAYASGMGAAESGATVRADSGWGPAAAESGATVRQQSAAWNQVTVQRKVGRMPLGLLVGGLIVLACLGIGVSMLLLRSSSAPQDPVASTVPPPTPSTLADPITAAVPSDAAASDETGGIPRQQNDESDQATTASLPSGTSGAEPSSTASSPSPDPTAPSRSATSRPTRSTRGNKPLTDQRVRTRLVRSLEKHCRHLGEGTALTVDLLVGTDGRILNKRVEGGSGYLRKCALEQVGQAKFPTGNTRRVTIRASL